MRKMEFLKRKRNPFYHLDEKNIMILKNSTGPSPSNQTNKEGNPVKFLRFHVDNSIQSITTGMNPIRNMNHKRKYLLNRLQEYQLQYLLSKEESFQ
uniref:Photosystem II reaction center protein J n=2 Tax=Solanum TaxID=4107 RepID=M1BF91_SOLTU